MGLEVMKQIYLKKLIKTIVTLVILLFAVSVVTFALASLSPIDPIWAYVNGDTSLSAEQLEVLAEYWGLNEPPVTRYFKWLGNLLSGDFGNSLLYRSPVINIIKERFFMSITLMFVAWTLSGIMGFFMGVIAGVYKGSFIDYLIKTWCLILQSSPGFWIALLLILLFSVRLGWFPLGFAVPIGVLAEDVTIWNRIHHLVLPSFTLALTSVSHIALHTREKMIQALESDYAVFSISRGLSKWRFVCRHGLRNIMTPAITLHFFNISEIFGGSILAESVFNYPGLGEAAVDAGMAGDMPLLLAITLISALFVFIGNQTANLLYPLIDPRIKGGNLDV